MEQEATQYGDCPVVELRQYTLYPEARDILIELFDREFVESQESVGIRVLGQFRDLDDDDQFVWLRGFSDMRAREQSLKEFYSGTAWKAHRETANATMINSDNVLLLRPPHPGSGFSFIKSSRPPRDTDETPKGLVIATIYHLCPSADAEFVDFFERTLKPQLIDTGASLRAYFVTESSANTFPALPVREAEKVFVWFSSFQHQPAYEQFLSDLSQSDRWATEISGALNDRLKKPSQVLRLSPTNRSLLRA